MDLKFSGLVLDPFFCNGFNLAILQSLHKRSVEMKICNISATGFAKNLSKTL